jgi:DNA-directed RNA polymerase specialized sigma subunit
MTEGEIAAVLGVSRQGAQYLIRKALQRFSLHWQLLFGNET